MKSLEDLDEDAVEPTVDPEESRDRINHIQCKDEDLSHKHPEEEAICKEKEGDWGTGPAPEEPKAVVGVRQGEEQVSNPTIVWGGGPIAPAREQRTKKDSERETKARASLGAPVRKEDPESQIPRSSAERTKGEEQTVRQEEQRDEA